MPNRKDLVRIQHMLDAMRKSEEFIRGRCRADLDSDEKLTLALIRLLEIIGEAAKAVSFSLQKRYPKVSWREIAGTRDRLIHGYFDVDLDIVWEIVSKDLPALTPELEKMLSGEKKK